MTESPRKIKWKTLFGITLSIVLLIIVVLILHTKNQQNSGQKMLTLPLPTPTNRVAVTHAQSSISPISPPPVAAAISPTWHVIAIHKGDTLEQILLKNKIHYQDIKNLLQLTLVKEYLRILRLNEKLLLQINNNELTTLKYPINTEETLIVQRDKNTYQAKIDKKPVITELKFKYVTKKSDLSLAMYKQLEKIFSDYLNGGLHSGDHFTVLYREYYINGHKYRAGHILAAEFFNHKKAYSAVRFTDSHDHTSYYTRSGKNIESRFTFPPLNYDYISGRFTYHRMDPYLHEMRPHLGVDFAAKEGTPVHSIGDGRVIFAGRDDGYGDAIIVSYGSEYHALYAHLEHFAKNIREGTAVQRGEIIGYVGTTGWSTGPHLHFGFYVDGVAKNPLTMTCLKNQSVPYGYLAKYRRQARELLAELKMKQHAFFDKLHLLKKHD